MRRTIILLASLTLSGLSLAGNARAGDLPDEAACLDQGAPFADCVYAIQEARSVVSAERPIAGTASTGQLNISYIIAQFGALRDGMDLNTLAFLKFEYLVDGQIRHSSHKKIGSFLSFDSFERPAAGKYLFSGEVFSDEQGCLVSHVYEVDATDYTVALRAGAATLPELKITQRSGDCN